MGNPAAECTRCHSFGGRERRAESGEDRRDALARPAGRGAARAERAHRARLRHGQPDAPQGRQGRRHAARGDAHPRGAHRGHAAGGAPHRQDRHRRAQQSGVADAAVRADPEAARDPGHRGVPEYSEIASVAPERSQELGQNDELQTLDSPSSLLTENNDDHSTTARDHPGHPRGAASVLLSQASPTPAAAIPKADPKDWIQLFNGKNLDGWTPKFAKHDLGENYNDTFRVENGLLEVRYDKWQTLQRRVRPHVLQGSLQLLRHRRGIPLRRRAGEGRRPEPGVGDPQQRPDAPRARSEDHDEGSGLPDLDRGAAARRLRQAADDRQPVHARHQRRHGTTSSRPGTASTRSRRPTRATSGCASRCWCTATS